MLHNYIVHGEKSNKISHPSMYYNKKYYIVAVYLLTARNAHWHEGQQLRSSTPV